MLECYRVHFFPEWFKTHLTVSVDVFRYPITYSTSETSTTYLILVQHTLAWYPDPNAVPGLLQLLAVNLFAINYVSPVFCQTQETCMRQMHRWNPLYQMLLVPTSFTQ